MSTNTKRGFRMPNNYVVVFCIIVLAMVMTYIIPAGSYDRAQDPDTGRTVVVDGRPAGRHELKIFPKAPWAWANLGIGEIAVSR